MATKLSFEGVYPILATPFHDDESVDLESMDRLIRFMAGLRRGRRHDPRGPGGSQPDARPRARGADQGGGEGRGRPAHHRGHQPQRDAGGTQPQPDGAGAGGSRGDGDAPCGGGPERGARVRVLPHDRFGDRHSGGAAGSSRFQRRAHERAADAAHRRRAACDRSDEGGSTAHRREDPHADPGHDRTQGADPDRPGCTVRRSSTWKPARVASTPGSPSRRR